MFLKAPLDYFRISSRFSGRRFHPVQMRFGKHITEQIMPLHMEHQLKQQLLAW
jgi:hypothetical protein